MTTVMVVTPDSWPSACTVTWWSPLGSGVVAVQLKVPSALACVVQTGVPSTNTVTVEFGGAVPVKVGVWPVVVPVVGVTNTGGVPTWKGTAVEVAEMPPALLAVAVTWCMPFDRSLVAAHEKWPVESAVAVQTCEPSTDTATIEPASAVPVKVGVVLVVAFAAGEVITGAAGTGVMVKVLGVELALPPGVVEVTVTLWLPSPSGVVGVHEK